MFDGISINLTTIMMSPSLITRALQTMATLLTVLVVCSLLLVQGESATFLGIEVLTVGGGSRFTSSPVSLAALPVMISGAVLLSRGFAGLYWVVPDVIFCLLDASDNAWVLLIEINR